MAAPQQSPPSTPWRPPSYTRSASHTRRMFIAVGVAIFVAGWCLFAFSRFAQQHPQSINLGGRTFVLGQAAKHVQQAKVGPLYFNDLVRDSRVLPLVLSLVGDKQWAALNAVPPGEAATCAVTWDPTAHTFVDPCTQKRFAPDGVADDGTALTRYSAVENSHDQIVVDLNTPYSASAAADTSIAPTTTAG